MSTIEQLAPKLALKDTELQLDAVKRAAKNLMRLCMQGWCREQIDKAWGEGQTQSHVDDLCSVLGIVYP